MRQPTIYQAKTLNKWDVFSEVQVHQSLTNQTSSTTWVPARPEPNNMVPWWARFKVAWLVFTGKCDAVVWNIGDLR